MVNCVNNTIMIIFSTIVTVKFSLSPSLIIKLRKNYSFRDAENYIACLVSEASDHGQKLRKENSNH